MNPHCFFQSLCMWHYLHSVYSEQKKSKRLKENGFKSARKHLLLCPLATNKNLDVKMVFCAGFDVKMWMYVLVTELQSPLSAVSHVSVLDVLPVHQHVLPAQHPHLALTRHHMALKLVAAVSVNMRGRDAVDAVLCEAGHRL